MPFTLMPSSAGPLASDVEDAYPFGGTAWAKILASVIAASKIKSLGDMQYHLILVSGERLYQT